jgi:hypothetical protein
MVESLQIIELARLKRCPIQFRPVLKHSLDFVKLRNSIRDCGLLESLLVRPVGDYFEVVHGAQRYEALLDLHETEAPCIMKILTDEEVYIIQVEAHSAVPVANLDYTVRLWKLIAQHKEWDLCELSYAIHRHVDWVSNHLNLHKLSKEWKNRFEQNQLPLTVAIELIKLPHKLQDTYLTEKDVSTADLKERIQQHARHHRENTKDIRIERKLMTNVNLGPQVRNLGEIANELNDPTFAASVISNHNAKTPLEIWKAALKWVLRVDKESLLRRQDAAEKLLS